jgi:hypothetical protein
VNLIDRFTRDERSAVVWWPFTILLFVLCLATFPGANRAVQAERSAAEDRSISILQGSLVGALGTTDLSAPLAGGTAEVTREALHDVLTDARINAIRLWDADGALLFSSLARDGLGSAAALNDAQVRAAEEARGTPVSVLSRQTLTGQPAPTTFQTYLGLVGTSQPVVGEVEYSDAALLASTHAVWLGYRIALAAAVLLVLGLAILSMREPMATMGVGVPFYESSIPHGYVLKALDGQALLGRSNANAWARITDLETRLRESDEARRNAEGQLQRALSSIASRMNTGIDSVIPRPAAPVEAASPAVAASAEPTKMDRRPQPVTASALEPADRAAMSEPIVVTDPEPAEVPRATRSRASKPKSKLPVPEPAAPEPESVAPKEPERPMPVRATKPVRLPDVDRGFVLRVPEAAQDESAVDMLERLVDPTPNHGSGVDPSVVRARLTRLAASKKPGPRVDEPNGAGGRDPAS